MRVKFTFVTDLAEMAAQHISEKEGKPCDRSTLLRSKKYKGLLLSYMADHMAEGTDSINRDAIRDPAARALLDTADYSIENLTRENERLKNYVTELTGNLAEAESRPQALPAPKAGSEVDSASARLSQDRLRYLTTCEALHAVLERFGGIVKLDPSADRIMDATESPAAVLVGEKVAKAFFEWLRQNGVNRQST